MPQSFSFFVAFSMIKKGTTTITIHISVSTYFHSIHPNKLSYTSIATQLTKYIIYDRFKCT